jgi:hypothetical protein
MYLGSGFDHMAAVVTVLRSQPLSYLASFTLNRAVLEAAARAYWLAQDELGTGTRISRALLDRMDSVRSQSELFPPGNPKHREAQIRLTEQTDKILSEARQAHLKIHTYGGSSDHRGQPCQLGKEVRPGPTKAVDELLVWVYGTKEPWFYRHLSAFSHSTIYAIRQGAEVVVDQGDGFKMLEAKIDMVQLSTTCVACAHCHHMVLRLLGDVAGYPDSQESPLETVRHT